MKKILITLIVLSGLAFIYKQSQSGGVSLPFMTTKLVNPLPPSSPIFQQHQAFIDKVNANEKVVAKFGGAISSKGLFAILKDMHRRGAQSLPGKQIVAENRTMVAIMVRLPERSCAKLAKPRDDFDKELTMDILTAMEKLPARHHKNMTDFFYDAMVADVENLPIIPVNENDYQNALRDLQYTYHGSSAEKLMRIMGNIQAASDQDACWAVNSMMTAAENMPARNTEAFMRRSWSN